MEEPTVRIELTRPEIELLRTALGHLEATLGRDEADELAAVMQLLDKLERVDR